MNDYAAHWISRVRTKCVVTERGCWMWTGATHRSGKWAYGKTCYHRATVHTHRQMYKLVHAVELSPEQFVCHSCDEPLCCNPDHLWLGTASDNQIDASSKGRSRGMADTHCSRGHEFTDENTVWHNSKQGTGRRRMCVACRKLRWDRWSPRRRSRAVLPERAKEGRP